MTRGYFYGLIFIEEEEGGDRPTLFLEMAAAYNVTTHFVLLHYLLFVFQLFLGSCVWHLLITKKFEARGLPACIDIVKGIRICHNLPMFSTIK